MFNNELANTITTTDFKNMGFVFSTNGDDDPRSHDWNYKNNGFHICIDAWYSVTLSFNDSEAVEIKISNRDDLEALIELTNS